MKIACFIIGCISATTILRLIRGTEHYYIIVCAVLAYGVAWGLYGVSMRRKP